MRTVINVVYSGHPFNNDVVTHQTAFLFFEEDEVINPMTIEEKTRVEAQHSGLVLVDGSEQILHIEKREEPKQPIEE